MNLNNLMRKFLLNEEYESPNILSYIQALTELLNTLHPYTLKEKHNLSIAKQHLGEIRKQIRKMMEQMNTMEESIKLVKEDEEMKGMDNTCSSCKGAFHPSTGSEHNNIKLCWNCTLDFIKWFKKREAQMNHPKKGMKTSFTQAALTSIKPENKEK